jgi:hypothetical protein
MNDPLQQASFLPAAFTQVEGQLRSKAVSRPEGVTVTSAGSELPITATGNGRLMRYRKSRAYPTIQRLKTIQSP